MGLFNCIAIKDRLGAYPAHLATVLLETEPDTDRRLTNAYNRILGRPPRPSEREAWHGFLAGFDDPRTAWHSACRVLVSSNEFIFID